jgi:hypothetical protein
MIIDLSKRCNFCEGNVYVDVKHDGDKLMNDTGRHVKFGTDKNHSHIPMYASL